MPKTGRGETINNFIGRLQKTVEHCEFGKEEDNQIRDRILYFILDKVLQRKLYREDIVILTKLQESVSIFDEAYALLLTPSGTREEANTNYINQSSGFNSPARYCRKSMKKHMWEMLQNRTLSGLLPHHAVTTWRRCWCKLRRGRGCMERSRVRSRGKQNVRSNEEQHVE